MVGNMFFYSPGVFYYLDLTLGLHYRVDYFSGPGAWPMRSLGPGSGPMRAILDLEQRPDLDQWVQAVRAGGAMWGQ